MSYWAKLCWFQKLSFKFLKFWVGWFIIDCVILSYSRICSRDVWLLEIKNYFNVQKHNNVLYMFYWLTIYWSFSHSCVSQGGKSHGESVVRRVGGGWVVGGQPDSRRGFHTVCWRVATPASSHTPRFVLW